VVDEGGEALHIIEKAWVTHDTKIDRAGGASITENYLLIKVDPGAGRLDLDVLKAEAQEIIGDRNEILSVDLDFARPSNEYFRLVPEATIVIRFRKLPSVLPEGVWEEGQPCRGWRTFDYVTDRIFIDNATGKPVHRLPHLCGQYGRIWNGRYQTAMCLSMNGGSTIVKKEHQAVRRAAARLHLKKNQCMCGLYGHWDWKNTIFTGEDTGAAKQVLAAVVGWGATGLHEDGFRCQHMELEHLYYSHVRSTLEEQEKTADWLRRKFKVPVTLGTPDGRTAKQLRDEFVGLCHWRAGGTRCPTCGGFATTCGGFAPKFRCLDCNTEWSYKRAVSSA